MNTTAAETAALLARARAWAAEDPDPETAEQLLALAAAAEGNGAVSGAGRDLALRDLADRFAGPLAFGTAGLRAALGAGPNRMNRAVVRRTAAGLARYLLRQAGDAYVPTAVVGFDARHKSEAFALDTAAVFTAAGIETFLLPSPLPTPVLAWAVRALECEAGVMVTASHNPPQDNGYKVYLGGEVAPGDGEGAQIVSPADREIAALIDHDAPLGSIPLARAGWTVLPGAGEPGDLVARYVSDVAALASAGSSPAGSSPAGSSPEGPGRGLRIVFTPMHGVGGDTLSRVFAAAGFTDVAPVDAQAAPDPDFPTVDFPNPEEPGAMDLALAQAESSAADLVIATDPDADRCAVGAQFPGEGWRMLRGDEVGSLLGAYLAPRFRAEAEGAGRAVFANSIVSSRQLGRIAAAHGLEHRTTLTGFKWIARVPGLAYGYEEALGYCVAPDLVRDKDGISAALLVAELAAELKREGRSLPEALDELALVHGLYATDQLSVRVASLDLLGAMMGRLRAHPPASLAGSEVVSALDLAEGGPLPPTEGMCFLAADDTRVIVRPSGTEPKLKCYLEVTAAVGAADELPAARAAARERLEAVRRDVEEALGL